VINLSEENEPDILEQSKKNILENVFSKEEQTIVEDASLLKILE
jgi:ATP-dependent phosphoenolpyruvate carboxykinase